MIKLTRTTIDTTPIANAFAEVAKQVQVLFQKIHESNLECQQVIQEAHDTLVHNSIQANALTEVLYAGQEQLETVTNGAESIAYHADTMVEDMFDLADDGYVANYDFTPFDTNGEESEIEEEPVKENDEVKAE